MEAPGPFSHTLSYASFLSGFILLTEVSMTMEMDLAANFLIISWPHV